MDKLPRSLRLPRRMEVLLEQWRRNQVAFLRRYLALLALTVLVCWLMFQLLMLLEGQQHPWWRGFYWTVSTMTTLGLGDVVFESWHGQLLTVLVVVSGVVFMLVLLPLLLIQLPPWVEAQSAARVRRKLQHDMRGHVVLTHADPVTQQLVRTLERYGIPHVLLVHEVEQALRLSQSGWSVMAGELDHPETYRAARLERAILMAATGSDVRNSNAVFTARSVAPEVPILATADREVSVNVLRVAGSTNVLQLPALLGRALARRVLGGDALAHVVGRFDELLIAEANAARTPLVGRRLRDSNLRDLANVSVIGTWDRGEFEVAGPDTEIGPHTVLVLAGTRTELRDYDAAFAIYNVRPYPVLVIGGGRVGRATLRALEARGIDQRVVERDARLCQDERFVQGEASDPKVLEEAGIANATAVVITTHDDDMNVYLALYCRSLRPDVQIVSRATFERNVETLHRAGTDFVLSLASMGAAAIFNMHEGREMVTLSEGLNLFQVRMPAKLAGRTLAEIGLRKETGCSVVALRTPEGMQVNPDPQQPLPHDADAVLIGARESEARFFERYGE